MRFFAGRNSLRRQLLLPLGTLGAVLVVGLVLTYGLLSVRTEQDELAARARQGGATFVALLGSDERAILGTAHELATSRGVEEGLAGGGAPALRGDLVAAQVSQDLDFAAAVDTRGRLLDAVNLPTRLLEQTRAVETATLLLDTTTIEWIDEGNGERDIWLLAAAVHRRSDGVKDGAVVIGRELDQSYLDRIGAIVGEPVSIGLGGGTMGPATLPDTTRWSFDYRGLYGGDLQLIVHAPLADMRAAVLSGVLLIGGSGAVALVAFLVLSVMLVRRAVRPLDSLARIASRIASGELSERAPLLGADEVVETSRAFNTMVSALERRYEVEAAAAKTMEFQALHDVLTRLPNRALFHDRLGQALATAERGRSEVALLLMDLDAFKDVNDTYGHTTGDDLLKQIGSRCEVALRQSDTLARLGGDEFAVILPSAGADEARRVADRIRRSFERSFLVDGHVLRATVSIGIALSPLHAANGEDLLARADIAMYEAKKSSGVCTFSPALEHRSANRIVTTGELRQLLETGGPELHYQPTISLRDGRVDGIEALARWRHPVRGWVPPSEFIPLAEENGLIGALTESVLRAALRQAAFWWQAGFTVPVGVNLSMRDLLDPDVCQTVGDSLAAAGARPEMLRIEVTESAMMADPERAMDCTSQLRALGVRLSIDDFGTGYSSLAYLHKLHAHEVKIDRSFVATIVTDESSRTIVRVTIELAKALGLATVAEGVEDARTLQLLRALGCDSAQGYLITKPIPAEDVLPWVSAHASADVLDPDGPAGGATRLAFANR